MADNKDINKENINQDTSSLEREKESRKSLSKAIKRAEAIDRSRYTRDSYNKLKNAVSEGKVVLSSDIFKSTEINAAQIKIERAIDNLKYNDKEINKSAGIMTAKQSAEIRQEEELERQREEFDAQNSMPTNNTNDGSEDEERLSQREKEQRRIEKREREIQDTLNKKDELDRQKMKSGSDIGEGRGLGRDSGKKRYQERVVDELTNPDDWDKIGIDENAVKKDTDDVDEEVLKEEKRVKDERYIERHEAFNREERVPNNFVPHIEEEDEVLTPAARLAKQMQEEAELADAGYWEDESVNDEPKGISKKKEDKEGSEYDKKIQEKYGRKDSPSISDNTNNNSEPVDPLLQSREERVKDRTSIPQSGDEETLTPAAQAAKDMQNAAKEVGNTTKDASETINTLNQATGGGVSSVASSLKEGASKSEHEDEKKKQSHAKKAGKTVFETVHSNEDLRNQVGEQLDVNNPTNSVTDSQGIEKQVKKEDDFETAADRLLKKNEQYKATGKETKTPAEKEAERLAGKDEQTNIIKDKLEKNKYNDYDVTRKENLKGKENLKKSTRGQSTSSVTDASGIEAPKSKGKDTYQTAADKLIKENYEAVRIEKEAEKDAVDKLVRGKKYNQDNTSITKNHRVDKEKDLEELISDKDKKDPLKTKTKKDSNTINKSIDKNTKTIDGVEVREADNALFENKQKDTKGQRPTSEDLVSKNNSSFNISKDASAKSKSASISETLGFEEKKTEKDVETAAEKLLKKNQEKYSNISDEEAKSKLLNKKDKLKKEADKNLTKSKAERVDKKSTTRKVDGVDLKETNIDSQTFNKDTKLKGNDRVKSDELIKSSNRSSKAVDSQNKQTTNKDIFNAPGFAEKPKEEAKQVETSAEKMLRKNRELAKKDAEEKKAALKGRKQKEIKTVEQKRQEKTLQAQREHATKNKPRLNVKPEKGFNSGNINPELIGKKPNIGTLGKASSIVGAVGFDPKKKDQFFDEKSGKLKYKNANERYTAKDLLNKYKTGDSQDIGDFSYKKGQGSLKVGQKGSMKSLDGRRDNISNKKPLSGDAFVSEREGHSRFSRKELEKNLEERRSQYDKLITDKNAKLKRPKNKYESISTEGADSLAHSAGIKENDSINKQRQAVKTHNKGSIKMQRGATVDTTEKIYHKEEGGLRVGRGAGVEEKNTIAAGLKRKEENLNKKLRQEKEEELKKSKAIRQQERSNKNATDEYNELMKAENRGIKLNKGDIEESRKFGKDTDLSPNAKINTRYDKLNQGSTLKRKKDLRINTNPLKQKSAKKGLVSSAEKAKAANMTRMQYMQRQGAGIGMGQFNILGSSPQGMAGAAKAKAAIKAVAKKATSAAVISGIAVGSAAGGGGIQGKTNSKSTTHKWYPVAAHVSEEGLAAEPIGIGDDSKKTLTQAAVDMIEARIKAYQKIVMGEELTDEEKEKAGYDIKPIEEPKIRKFTVDGSKRDPNSIDFKNMKDYKEPHTYQGAFSQHTGTKKVGRRIPNMKFIDREGEEIGAKWFILDEFSDIEFPDGSKGPGAGKKMKKSDEDTSSNDDGDENTSNENESSNDNNNSNSTGTPPVRNDGVQSTDKPKGETYANGQTQMDIVINMLGACETGGMIYGNRDYGNIIGASLGAEVTMTIGWSSFYGENGRNYLQVFKQENPALFQSLDSSGEVNRSLNFSWTQTRFHGSGTWVNNVRKMLTSDEGKKLQDRMTAERYAKSFRRAHDVYGVKNARVVMWYTQLAELAPAAADRLFGMMQSQGDMSYANMKRNLNQSFSGGRFTIGGYGYKNRHAKIDQWLNEFVPEDAEIDVNNIEVTGLGAISTGGTGAYSAGQNKGLYVFTREMLSMSMTGSFYKDPANKKDYFKYIIDLIDYAVGADYGEGEGVEVKMTTKPTGGTVSWQVGALTDSAAEQQLEAEIIVPVMSDLKILQDNDKNFKKSWDKDSDRGQDSEQDKYGDTTTQSYMALHSEDFNELFNVQLSVGGGLNYGFNGVTGVPYVDWALGIAADDSHGYSQHTRAGGIDYDCSSLVWFSLKQAGFPLGDGWPFSTRDMGGILKGLGFQEFRFNPSELQPGDILVNPATHTEIYIGNGQTVGAHSSGQKMPGFDFGIHGDYGDQSGDEISVVPLGTYEWAYRPPKSYVDEINKKNKEKKSKKSKDGKKEEDKKEDKKE